MGNGECRRKAGAAATAPDGDGDADDAHEYAYEYAEDDGYDGEQGGGEGSDGDDNGLEGVYDDESTRATTVMTTGPEKTTFLTVIGPVTLLCTDRDDGFKPAL